MYCKNCGTEIAEGTLYCNRCGASLAAEQSTSIPGDGPSRGLALLGFFVSLAGFILFLVNANKRPERAISIAKGTMLGHLVKFIVAMIVLSVSAAVFAPSISEAMLEKETRLNSYTGETQLETEAQTPEDDYVKVSFGKFKIVSDGYLLKTSLDVNVKNIAEKQYTYLITIEAVDENGTRINTDTVYAEKLNAGQDINLTAFEYVRKEDIDLYRTATFKVLEVKKYSF